MRILLSPIRGDKSLHYNFSGEVITALLGDQADTFDFTGMPDGVLESIENTLPINPIIHAERVDGVLSVTLMNFIGADASEKDKFPEWMEV